MIDALTQSNHKIANIIYIVLNVLAILFGIASLVLPTMWFTNTDILPSFGFVRFVIGLGIFILMCSAAVLNAAFAQSLRYLCSIAETQGRIYKAPVVSTTP